MLLKRPSQVIASSCVFHRVLVRNFCCLLVCLPPMRCIQSHSHSDRLGRLGANLASLNAKGYGLAPALSIPPGFVKDPNSAWYINSTTGMYYDANSKSYLHAATGKYYYLDVATNSLKEWASASVAAVPSLAVTEADKFLQVIPPAMQCLFFNRDRRN